RQLLRISMRPVRRSKLFCWRAACLEKLGIGPASDHFPSQRVSHTQPPRESGRLERGFNVNVFSDYVRASFARTVTGISAGAQALPSCRRIFPISPALIITDDVSGRCKLASP